MNIYGHTADGSRSACNFSSKICASLSTYFHLHSKSGVNFSESPQYNKANAHSDGLAVECSLTGEEMWNGFALRTIHRMFSNLIRTLSTAKKSNADSNRVRIRFAVVSWILEKLQSCCTCRKNNIIQ